MKYLLRPILATGERRKGRTDVMANGWLQIQGAVAPDARKPFCDLSGGEGGLSEACPRSSAASYRATKTAQLFIEVSPAYH
jgi:hypothetical protein